MFRENKRHLQKTIFSTLDELPAKHSKRLEQSWAGTFYREFFSRIDERPFAALFSAVDSRPNIPINVLLGLEALKAGFGWSDESLWDAFCFDLQVRFALGYRNLGEGQFDLRTVYNFRARLLEHLRETGEDLLGQAFAQVTDAQLSVIRLKTSQVRMDSTLIASNIRNLSRLELLVVVLQRVQRMLSEIDQARYAADLAPYLQGSSKQYVYRVSKEEGPQRIVAIGLLMQRLVSALEPLYAQDATYQLLQRVFREHFAVENEAARPKHGQELSADSLESPDDLEASYHCKRGASYKGYTANVSETCAPENPVQLIVMVQTAPNTTNDDDLMIEALPELKERLDVQELHTDGGYNSLEAYEACRQQDVAHIQTAIRGHSATVHTGLEAFDIATSVAGVPQSAVCPRGATAVVELTDKPERYVAHFPLSACATCPLGQRCLTRSRKRAPYRSLCFDAHDLEIARRRQRIAHDRQLGRNLRAAVESTIAALKRPFGDKLPVRGWFRMHSWMIHASLLLNVRRIHRYQRKPPRTVAQAAAMSQNVSLADTLTLFLLRFSQVRAHSGPWRGACSSAHDPFFVGFLA